MSLKKEISEYLNTATDNQEVVVSDSVVIIKEETVEKIPTRKCREEIYILNLFKDMGIPTVDIISSQRVVIPLGEFESYTMRRIPNVESVIHFGNKYLNENFYQFLYAVLSCLKTVKFKGFGAITLTANQIVETEFHSEKELLSSRVDIAERRNNCDTAELHKTNSKIALLEDRSAGNLVHSDILNNILVNRNGEFVLIDPQTNVSSGNEYWDLSLYLIYAYAFGCSNGLESLMNLFSLDDYNRFFITCKANAFERLSYYKKYDPSKVSGIIQFMEDLDQGKFIAYQRGKNVR
jgi:hypothetical protein